MLWNEWLTDGCKRWNKGIMASPSKMHKENIYMFDQNAKYVIERKAWQQFLSTTLQIKRPVETKRFPTNLTCYDKLINLTMLPSTGHGFFANQIHSVDSMPSMTLSKVPQWTWCRKRSLYWVLFIAHSTNLSVLDKVKSLWQRRVTVTKPLPPSAFR